MNSILNETMVRVSDVPNMLPRKRPGRKIHRSTVHRWISRGVRGGIQLQAARIGGTLYTSVEALGRFCEALTQSTPTSTDAPPTPRQREREIARAARELDRLLGVRPHED